MNKKAAQRVTRRRGFLSFVQKAQTSGFCAHSSSPGEGMQGSYDADDMLLRRPAVLRPEEMRNNPHEADRKKTPGAPARRRGRALRRRLRGVRRVARPVNRRWLARRDRWQVFLGRQRIRTPAASGLAGEVRRRAPSTVGPPRRPAAPRGSPPHRRRFWPITRRPARAPARLDVLLPRPGGGPPGAAPGLRAAAGRRAHAPAAART